MMLLLYARNYSLSLASLHLNFYTQCMKEALFSDEGTEAQRVGVTCLRSHSRECARDSNHCGLAPESTFLIAAFCCHCVPLDCVCGPAPAIRGPKNQ